MPSTLPNLVVEKSSLQNDEDEGASLNGPADARKEGEGGRKRGGEEEERMKMHRRGVEPTCENMPWTIEVDCYNDNIIMDGGKWKEWNG